MTLTEFLILALATWRITSYLAEEDGPFGVFVKLRHVAGVRFDEYSEVYGTNEFARQLMCVWCIALPIGVIWTISWLLLPVTTFYVALPFAFATATIIVNARGVRHRKRS